MRGWARSLRVQFFIILVLSVSTVIVLAGLLVQITVGIVGARQLIESTTLQRTNTYLIASIARRMSTAANDDARQNLSTLLLTTIQTFEDAQRLLREGDATRDIPPFRDPQLTPILQSMDQEWFTYRATLETFVSAGEDQDEALLSAIDAQSVAVFIFADRLVQGISLVIDRQVRLSQQILVATLTLTVIVAVTAVVVVARAARNISHLSDMAQKVAEGNLDARASTEILVELATVAHSFNTMVQAVQQRDEALRVANQTLEQRVAERTQDMKRARDDALTAQRIALENSRVKSEFLATMSHELRTPLNAIEGFTSIMLSGMGVELSTRAEDMVRRVGENSKRLLRLINDFLDLSRVEAGRLELVEAPMDLESLARRWQSQIGVLADEKGIAFTVDIDPTMPVVILGDEDALSKIALNLLGNAIKFTHKGRVTLRLSRAGTHWKLAVIDTGIGIPLYAREYIFEEFRQVDGSSKRLYGGTGLGLSLVQKLARALGGSVAVQSEVGQGSTFTVTLPINVPVLQEVTAS